MSNSLRPYGWQPASLLYPWDFPGESTGVRCHFCLQGIFPSLGLNTCPLHLLHWQVKSLPLSHLGSPLKMLPAWKFLLKCKWFSYSSAQWNHLEGFHKLFFVFPTLFHSPHPRLWISWAKVWPDFGIFKDLGDSVVQPRFGIPSLDLWGSNEEGHIGNSTSLFPYRDVPIDR